jgi:hypothetical protein
MQGVIFSFGLVLKSAGLSNHGRTGLLFLRGENRRHHEGDSSLGLLDYEICGSEEYI